MFINPGIKIFLSKLVSIILLLKLDFAEISNLSKFDIKIIHQIMKKLKKLYYIFVAFATDFYKIKCIISLYLKKKQV